MSEPGCLRAPLARYPGFNRFVLDWLSSRESAVRFLPRATELRERGAQSPEVSQRKAEVANALIATNQRWGLFVENDVRQWESGEAVTLVAGQQVGFAGGPLYTLAKIASLVRMKRDLEAQGRKATAFFWLATEDHDFDEVANIALPVQSIGGEKSVNRQLDLLKLRAVRGLDGHSVVGSLPLPEVLIAQLLSVYDMPRPSWLREGVNFRDSFAELLATVFGGEIVLIDALQPELRRAAAPLFDAITAKWDDVQHAIGARSVELQQAGYAQQVVPREGESYTLLFHVYEDGTRSALGRPEQLVPEQTSTSALTRPLLQDFVLQPDVFVGGPAEVAYYAQIAPLHDLLGVPMPRVALRAHALVAPKRNVRAMERLHISADEVFASADEIVAAREPEGVARVRELADAAHKELLTRIEELGQIALPADHALARAFNRSVGHIEFHFGKLAERSIKGLVRKDKERHAAVRELVATLYPDRHVQDRVVSWFSYWCHYDRYLVDRLIDCVEPDSDSFVIVGL
ncbi:MAG TPA: bacillithiol biosynthesis BshC [Thermoanaerobaculia bacterium]